MRILISILLLAAVFSAGCAGPLKIDIWWVSEVSTVEYHLAPEGLLTVESPDVATGEKTSQLHKVQLGEGEMDKLRQVVMRSGFFMEDSLDSSTVAAAGPMVRVEVELGLWHNRLDAGGGRKSVSKIIEELNRHLPAAYRLPYSSEPAKPPEEEPW